MQKYINSNIACTKQTIIPLYDYADFLIESGPMYYIDRLDTLHEKAIQLIDCKGQRDENIVARPVHYKLITPEMGQV